MRGLAVLRSRAVTLAARVTIVTIGFAVPGEAQRFEGRVTLPDGTPATRVLLEAVRADGTVAARALSDEGGRYVVDLPGAGRFALRALRIGFRPTLVPARDVRAEARITQAIALTSELVSLEEVRVATDAVCSPAWRGDTIVLFLWEEARKALQTAQLTAQRSDLAMTVRAYEALASARGAVHPASLTAFWKEASTVRPFESAPEAVLVAEGYVVPQVTGTIYRAPDFDVLLAPSFAETHCMRVVAATESQPGAIGLEFEPNRERRRSDIAGVIWLDRATAFLRELEFAFTGIAGASLNRQGGRVRFLALPTGHWIVSAWELRMPRPLETALTVIGGEVGEVRRGEQVLHTTGGPFDDLLPTHESVITMTCGEAAIGARWGMLRGEVIGPDGMPAVNASVSIEWSDGSGSQHLAVSTGPDGTWHACQVPLVTRLEVSARRGDGSVDAVTRLARDERVAELLLTLSRSRSPAGRGPNR